MSYQCGILFIVIFASKVLKLYIFSNYTEARIESIYRFCTHHIDCLMQSSLWPRVILDPLTQQFSTCGL